MKTSAFLIQWVLFSGTIAAPQYEPASPVEKRAVNCAVYTGVLGALGNLGSAASAACALYAAVPGTGTTTTVVTS